MRRREFLTLVGSAVVACPTLVRGQQPAMPVIGVLTSVPLDVAASHLAGFTEGLNAAGYIEGRNVVIKYSSAENNIDRLPELAADLVRDRVTLIATFTIRPTLAVKAATSTIPIVFGTANDPVRQGIVASLNRPGGNATGVSWLAAELGVKRLDLLHELIPATRTIGVLVNPRNANAGENVKEAEEAARQLGLQTLLLKASDVPTLDSAFAALAPQQADALLVLNDPLFNDLTDHIVALAARHALPAIYSGRQSADAGGLMSYGASIPKAYRQAGLYAGRILKGEKPADLPVIQSDKFEMIINLKTAKTLGLTVPKSLMLAADAVIE